MNHASLAETKADKRRGESRRLVRGSSLMLAGRLVSVAINFAVQVLIVRFLMKADYGAFAYGMSVVTFGSSLAVFGLGKTFNRFVPIYQERHEYREMAGTVFLTLASVFGIGVGLVLLVFGFWPVASEYVTQDPLTASLLFILILLVPVQAVNNVLEKMFAVFASPRALFVRRYMVGPGLKLLAVLPLAVFPSNVRLLAVMYVAAGLLAAVYSVVVLWSVLRTADLLRHFQLGSLRIPARKIYAFSAPLVVSDLLPVFRAAFVTVALEFFHGALGVAAFRAVLPLARLNHATIDSFKLLFTPTISRMFARGDQSGIEHAYWTSSAWIAVITFPLFIVCVVLATPITVLLFGKQYASSAPLVSILSCGFYMSAILGFSGHVLRAYGRVGRIFVNDVSTVLSAIVLTVCLVPRWSAMGGAFVTATTLLIGVTLNQAALIQYGYIRGIGRAYQRLFLTIAAVTIAAALLQVFLVPPEVVAMALAVVATLVVVWASLPVLEVDKTFPELRRMLPFGRGYSAPRNAKKATSTH